MTYHIWNLVSESCSLWVKWIHAYRLRRRNFWDIPVAWDASWSWKNILALREEVRPFVRSLVGNGESTNFWFDTWALDFPFSKVCSHRDIVNMGFNKFNKVADFSGEGQVEWPEALLLKIPSLQGLCIRLTGISDKVGWLSKTRKIRNFSVSQVWNDLRLSRDKVLWWSLIWFPKSIPKHSFMLWLAIRKRLLTQDRLQSWQIQNRAVCSFCERMPDSVDHLFFECVFCKIILEDFQSRGYLLEYQGDWNNFIQMASAQWVGKSIHVLINKLTLAALIFHIWLERNRRLFQSKKKQRGQIISDVEDEIRKKLQGIVVVNSLRVREELLRWGIGVERPSIQFNYDELC
ncbi:uncharacterized protein LOC141705609 [Apium graveolens]|uniref:uncharacterized protein LOC141705609 n=1 Tax=Apium graveolens TaxID=4045 RepID=UPI003D792650